MGESGDNYLRILFETMLLFQMHIPGRCQPINHPIYKSSYGTRAILKSTGRNTTIIWSFIPTSF